MKGLPAIRRPELDQTEPGRFGTTRIAPRSLRIDIAGDIAVGETDEFAVLQIDLGAVQRRTLLPGPFSQGVVTQQVEIRSAIESMRNPAFVTDQNLRLAQAHGNGEGEILTAIQISRRHERMRLLIGRVDLLHPGDVGNQAAQAGRNAPK